jgi:hypothetical protein
MASGAHREGVTPQPTGLSFGVPRPLAAATTVPLHNSPGCALGQRYVLTPTTGMPPLNSADRAWVGLAWVWHESARRPEQNVTGVHQPHLPPVNGHAGSRLVPRACRVSGVRRWWAPACGVILSGLVSLRRAGRSRNRPLAALARTGHRSFPGRGLTRLDAGCAGADFLSCPRENILAARTSRYDVPRPYARRCRVTAGKGPAVPGRHQSGQPSRHRTREEHHEPDQHHRHRPPGR